MIYAHVRAHVESHVPEIAGKLFPVSACIDSLSPPFAFYAYADTDDACSLSGRRHHTVDTMMFSVVSPDYDEASRIYMAIKAALLSLRCTRIGDNKEYYVMSVTCAQTEDDGFDVDTGLVNRALQAQISWQ